MRCLGVLRGCLFDPGGEDVLYAQQIPAFGRKRQKAVDIGMLTGILAGVFSMLGIEFQPFAGCLRSNGAVDLPEVVIDRKRAGLARLVLYCRQNRAAAVEQLKVWADRAGADFMSKPTGSDAAALGGPGERYSLNSSRTLAAASSACSAAATAGSDVASCSRRRRLRALKSSSRCSCSTSFSC